MSDAASQLHPLLRHHLVNTLGWRSLRPLQELAIPEILRGNHALMLAPTAGGKTEAAMFPLISRMLTEEWADTSILYLCPLKALLNNLENRLNTYFGMVGYQSALWHGDVNASARERIRRGLPACVLTTPESLESMLVSAKRENRAILRSVRAVVIDEIHAFAGDDRGTHLLCLLERVARIVPHRIQRVGLSATVGNPKELLEWLTCGREPGQQSIVAIAPAPAQTEVRLDYVGNIENASLVISRLFRGEKRLVFCDSRRRVEELTHLLKSAGVDAFASHSSLSAESRKISEQAFADGRDCVIVATSTLELGIDVGDLDRVIQIDAPGSVASFLQRIGRTGRRSGAVRNCLFLATNPESLLQAAAILQLWEEGFVEPVIPPRHPYHLVAHQALTLCLQKGRIALAEFIDEIAAVPGIKDLPKDSLLELIEYMVSTGHFIRDGAFLLIGPTTEKDFGRRHYLALLSVFSTSERFEVLEGQRCIGFVDWLSLSIPDGKERKPLILGGASWDIRDIEWSSRKVQVIRSREPGKTRWHGSAIGLSFDLAQAIQKLLISSEVSPRWTQRAEEEIRLQREELGELAQMAGNFYSTALSPDVLLPTFYGSAINKLLAMAFEMQIGQKVTADDLAIRMPASHHMEKIMYLFQNAFPTNIEQAVLSMPEASDALKFSQCLPPGLATKAFLGKIKGLANLNEKRA